MNRPRRRSLRLEGLEDRRLLAAAPLAAAAPAVVPAIVRTVEMKEVAITPQGKADVQAKGGLKHTPNEILVLFKPGVHPHSLLKGTHVKILHSDRELGTIALVTLDKGITVEQAIRAYSRHKGVMAQPNYILSVKDAMRTQDATGEVAANKGAEQGAPMGPTIQTSVNTGAACDSSKILVHFKPGVEVKSALPGTTVIVQHTDAATGTFAQVQLSRGVTVAQALKAYSSIPGVEAQADQSQTSSAKGQIPPIPKKTCWYYYSVRRYRRVLGSQKCYIGQPVWFKTHNSALNQRMANQLANAWRAQGFLVEVRPMRMG
jgi:hypothetical protein